jgi:transcriptional regulator with XRE-family HTH domain
MPTRERPIDRGRRIARSDLARIGEELRAARLGAGMALARVGEAVGLSASHVSRIERGLLATASVDQLARVGAILGLDVRVRAYPGPDPIRDAPQNALLDRLRVRLHPRLTLPREVPILGSSDQRAWDGMIRGLQAGPGLGSSMPVEGETRIHDFQAQTRRIWLKAADSTEPYVLLVVADTRRNREAVRAAGMAINDAFPVPARRALAALAAGEHPGGSALVML